MTEQFLNYLRYERNRSDLTVMRYELSLRDFETFFKAMDSALTWETVDADVIRQWMETLMDKGHKASSVDTDLSAIRSFYRFALSRGLVKKDPARAITGPKKEKPLPQFVKESEIDDLIDGGHWDANNIKNVRARTIIILLYEMGLRRAELTGLDDRDVDFATRQIKVTGKRRKQRMVPFGEEVEKALRQYIGLRDRQPNAEKGPLFVSDKGKRLTGAQVYSIVRQQLTGFTSLTKRSPHVLRHSYATSLLNHGADIESVRQLLGHESIETTMIYTHATFEQMKRVYKESHPRG
jgi:integrase/recombinase XerC